MEQRQLFQKMVIEYLDIQKLKGRKDGRKEGRKEGRKREIM
jgi:hypothetical protein